jgi:hypothetical protein
MREKINWNTVSNPRKNNGDLGDFDCNVCGEISGAYIIVNTNIRICKGCLYDGIDRINETILDFQ